MTDWRALIEEDGEQNLFLRESPESSEQVREILKAISEHRKEMKVLSPAYYENIIINWKDKLLRYPLAVAPGHPLIELYGMDAPVPLVFLGEMKERFVEIETACELRSKGADLPFICHYVNYGTVLVSCEADGVLDKKVQAGIPADRDTVVLESDGGRLLYTAKTAGFMIFGKKGLRILSPFIKEDEPFFLTLRLVPLVSGTAELADFVNDFLEEHLGHYANSPRPEESFSEKTIRRQGLYTYHEISLLSGIRPEEGRDSQLNIRREREEEEERAGIVDYHNICRINTAREGDIVAVKTPAVIGRDGRDIYGKEYSVSKGKDTPVRAEENIREQGENGEIRYVAEVSGVVSIKDNAISLKETMVIEGDVDYSTGNVSYDKNIHIKGDVRSGFSVSCRGDLLIEGGVEDKVRIDCRGAVKIRKGVIGESASVKAGKDLVCGFIERADVLCLGDVEVERNILGGQISCMGNLTVIGKGLSKKKVGALSGVVCRCYKHINVLSIGAEANKTTVHLGFNCLIEDKIGEIDEVLNGFNIRLSQLMDRLPFDLTAPGAVEKLKSIGPGLKEKIKKILLQIKKLNGEVSNIEKGRRNLLEKRFNPDPKEFSLVIHEGIRGLITVCRGEDLSENFLAQEGGITVAYDITENSMEVSLG